METGFVVHRVRSFDLVEASTLGDLITLLCPANAISKGGYDPTLRCVRSRVSRSYAELDEFEART